MGTENYLPLNTIAVFTVKHDKKSDFDLFLIPLATADKPEDQCELPGCQQPKRKEGTRVHDYCCLDHAKQDAPNRDGE